MKRDVCVKEYYDTQIILERGYNNTVDFKKETVALTHCFTDVEIMEEIHIKGNDLAEMMCHFDALRVTFTERLWRRVTKWVA